MSNYLHGLRTVFSALVLILLIALSLLIVPTTAPIAGIILVCLYALPPTRRFAKNKAYHLWRGYDCWANAYLWHDSRETISSRLGKSLLHGHPAVFVWRTIDRAVAWLLDAVVPGHCTNAIDWRVGRPFDWQTGGQPYGL